MTIKTPLTSINRNQEKRNAEIKKMTRQLIMFLFSSTRRALHDLFLPKHGMSTYNVDQLLEVSCRFALFWKGGL